MTIPLASVYLSSIFTYIIVFLILLLNGLLSYNTLYVTPLLTEVDLLGGLLQTSQYLPMYETVLSFLVPIMIYHNVDTDKSQILKENKGKAGIYQFYHQESMGPSPKKYI